MSSLFIDFHVLQNFAPSLLNRDDTGAHKDAMFGGVRRARISSQCLKRAMREHWKRTEMIDPADQAVRTKRLLALLVERLVAAGRDASDAEGRVRVALGGLRLGADEQGMSQYLLFLGADELDRLARVVDSHWDQLVPGEAQAGEATGTKPGKKKAKTAAQDACPAEVVSALNDAVRDTRSIEVRLFGRMLADRPEFNSDASLQVAHALGTSALEREFDFFTAVDDLQPEESAGAGMLGQVEFASACFYRYATLDLRELHQLLGGDREFTRRALGLVIDAMVNAVPTGKQNTFAAHQKPAYIGIQIGTQPRSLANAFEKPVRAPRDKSLTGESVDAIESFRKRLDASYGDNGPFHAHHLTDAKVEFAVDSVASLLKAAIDDAMQRLG